MLGVGQKFPEFSLTATVSLDRKKAFDTINQDTYKGKWKVVFFWPKDFTFVCPTEIAAFGKLNKDFKDRDAQLLGASVDSEFVHLAWRDNHTDLKDLPFPMLADIKRELSRGARHPGSCRGREPAGDLRRGPGERDPVRHGHGPVGGTEYRGSAARSGCAADG